MFHCGFILVLGQVSISESLFGRFSVQSVLVQWLTIELQDEHFLNALERNKRQLNSYHIKTMLLFFDQFPLCFCTGIGSFSDGCQGVLKLRLLQSPIIHYRLHLLQVLQISCNEKKSQSLDQRKVAITRHTYPLLLNSMANLLHRFDLVCQFVNILHRLFKLGRPAFGDILRSDILKRFTHATKETEIRKRFFENGKILKYHSINFLTNNEALIFLKLIIPEGVPSKKPCTFCRN